MRRITLVFIGLFFYSLPLHAMPEDEALKKMIGHMLIVGFEEEKLVATSPIVEAIERYELGGVILFDRFYTDKSRVKNIRSSEQLKALTHTLKASAKTPLLICVDQEGGKVARLKPSYGFVQTPSALKVASESLEKAKETYDALALMLREHGINCNFAPDVDLSLNPKNSVIVGLERSYGTEPHRVVSYAGVMLESFVEHNITGVLKHFPGHGSSFEDSHLGFVDVTQTWSEVELDPYRMLIAQEKASMIMSAHVFNAKLDKNYPATLSYATNTLLLRQTLGFKGVLVSDDMHMQAIANDYSLKDAITLAINSGVDMLLFGNQLSYTSTHEIIETIATQVKSGAISLQRIREANTRIEHLRH
ncbi:glycoside hydrolase family 3 protein [Sulfurospirillum barnesii]|uniref:beta-N-acetylhexosaminidase n=1 Tax=Sulfurospirillum barnesii (strain ATCC 700032 / DSM 10660 / SES-3) TaxID=760154 RepID=I3XX16_SULBS|nr:glycoside hydrolase family 3 N-terminal domain-containing protein [Sulfurospirillum barnesii]AFL68490.1 beta-glucosidase-like glycosyl hydrolase [Sulfurospirillum barnesii SES-3]